MAEEKKHETFLRRWSRLKQEQPPSKVPETPEPELPPVEQLTPQSDFKDFMHPKVEDALRRVALKKLFSDPHFNVPDAFEPFSGDWTGGEPIPQAMLEQHVQVKQLLRKPPEEAAATKVAEEEKEKPQPDEPARKDA